MKVALVHDYIKEYGGAERVLEALHELYPNATVYTSVFLPEFLGPHRERFAKWKIKTSFLQYIPGSAKLISPFRLLAPFAFRQFDLSSYDVVIVSATGAYFPNFIRSKNKEGNGAVQICYCHTPPRYLYGYATARNWKKNKFINILGEAANHILRIVDGHASNHVDYYVANSEEVASRIKKFYRKDATVIYPPVDLPEGRRHMKNSRTYYLTGGRLARAKHVDLLVRTATKLGFKLKVFGKDFAGYGHELAMLAGPTVAFLGEVSDEQKKELMSEAKAFLFASEDEDFGIVPVEAMGEGVPVIAYRSGGVKETVVAEKTGVFFDELTIESLTDAIKKFEKSSITAEACIAQAKKFSKERFMKEMKAFVTSKVSK